MVSSDRITYVIFDLLGLDGTDITERPYAERRSLLEQLVLDGPLLERHGGLR
jgi:ATP-dependent DNA ligase